MTTSGVVTFNRTRNEIIHQAGRKVGAWAAGETVGAQAITDFAEALNIMVKHWQGQGIHIWRTTEAALFLQSGQVRYSLGTTSSDHATESFTGTTVSANVASGETIISVTSTTGISASDVIGVQLDDGTMQWTTVNGAPTGSSVTLTDALTDSASDGNVVVAYTSALVRPLKVLSARRYNFDSAIDVPMFEMDRMEYQEMPNKTSASSVNGYYYDRRGGANSLGLFYVWPKPSSVDDCIKMTVARQIEDFTVAGDNADVPTEWLKALVDGLAFEMATEFNVPPGKYSMLEKRAAQSLAEATWGEEEITTVEFVPARYR